MIRCLTFYFSPKNKDAIKAGVYDIKDKPSQRTKHSMEREDDIINKAIAANKILKSTENKTLDLSGFRGNLFKQTLGADWDKPRNPSSQMSAKRDSIADKGFSKLDESYTATLSPTVQSRPAFDNSTLIPGGHFRGGFRKTVTNFKSIKYDDNGGLNPQSPYKRGIQKEVECESPTINNIDQALSTLQPQRNKSSFGRIAKPALELDHSERASSVFHPRKIVRDVDVSTHLYKKFSAFKRDVSPGGSKVDFQHFLKQVTKDKKHYDTNISMGLNHQKKILMYKNREQAQRAFALGGNKTQSDIHDQLTNSA